MNRKYKFGAIWQVPDEEIRFPNNLFRTKHNNRVVVIVENSELNADKNEDYILIAPLSSQTNIHHKLDIKIYKDNLNNLNKDESYIRMRAIQFIKKSSLLKYHGKVSEDIKDDIFFTLQSYFNCGQPIKQDTIQ